MKPIWIVLLLSCGALVGCGMLGEKNDGSALYLCGCGDDCTCNTVSQAAGKCSCSADLEGAHVIRMEGTTAVACTCNTECACTAEGDATDCRCGKPLRRVDLAGKGFYTCDCGGDCGCTLVSTEAGKCGCGKELKKVE